MIIDKRRKSDIGNQLRDVFKLDRSMPSDLSDLMARLSTVKMPTQNDDTRST